MGINIKYYVISIASIFISLGIGIFIGFNMNGQDLYLQQQQVLVNSLENRFSEFKKENEELEKRIQSVTVENEKQSTFIEGIFNETIHNKLEKFNIAIIETTDDYFYDDIYKVLKLSGANIPIRIQYTDKIFAINKEKLEEISEMLKVQLETTEDFVYLVNNEITNFLLNKEITEAFNYLVDEQYINHNINYNNVEELYVENVIIAGGSSENLQNKVEQLDVTLASKLDNLGFRVIGAERLDVEQSIIPYFKKLNIPTVDNINSKIGQTSLIYILRGAEGNYGEKTTAESLIPFVSIERVRSGEFE